jgi:hypothetical protein
LPRIPRPAGLRYAIGMRTWLGTSCLLVLAGGVGLAPAACDHSSGSGRTDAGIARDAPLLSGGSSGTGGALASGGVTGTAGSSALGGRPGTGGTIATGGSNALGGRIGTGGSLAAGGSGGSAGGVVLTASYDEQSVHATWQNHTEQSIFLAGCGTVQWSRFDGTVWSDGAPFMVCSWEGVAVEVAAGATFTENESGPPGGAGRYRLSGRYGVGCTPGVGLTAAGCTAFATVTSNEFVVARTRTKLVPEAQATRVVPARGQGRRRHRGPRSDSLRPSSGRSSAYGWYVPR